MFGGLAVLLLFGALKFVHSDVVSEILYSSLPPNHKSFLTIPVLRIDIILYVLLAASADSNLFTRNHPSDQLPTTIFL